MSTEPRDEAAGAADEPLDPAVDARVRAALAGAGPMPDDVWARISGALASEAATRAATASAAASVAAPVVALAAAPRRRRTPLLAGLAAAAALVVGARVIVPRLAAGTGGDIVADAPLPQAATAAPLTAQAPAAEAAPADAAAADAAPVEAGPAEAPSAPESRTRGTGEAGAADGTTESAAAGSAGAGEQGGYAARQVLMSGKDYRAETMDAEVMALVDTVGASRTRLMSSVAQEDPSGLMAGDSGFTSSMEGLAGCLAALTQSTERQALVIDRARFLGEDVAIVVVPMGDAAVDHSIPFDRIGVWVVGPDCGAVDPSIRWQGTVSMP